MRVVIGIVGLLVAVSSPVQSETLKSCVTIKALGCYFKVPGEVMVVADAPLGEGTVVSLGTRGTFRIVRRSAERQRNLLEESRKEIGHLEVIEYSDRQEREPALVTVIHDGVWQLELTRAAREYVDLVVASCLASTRPSMVVFRNLSECSLPQE